MKRSEMIEYIENELQEIINDHFHKSPRDLNFYKRKATGILDMLEGFGMLPPLSDDKMDETSHKQVNEWDKE